MATPSIVTSTLQNIVRLDLAIKASIHDINSSNGPVDELQRINVEARKNVQEVKRALDDLETFAKGGRVILVNKDIQCAFWAADPM